jgi:hypothetical protein
VSKAGRGVSQTREIIINRRIPGEWGKRGGLLIFETVIHSPSISFIVHGSDSNEFLMSEFQIFECQQQYYVQIAAGNVVKV